MTCPMAPPIHRGPVCDTPPADRVARDRLIARHEKIRAAWLAGIRTGDRPEAQLDAMKQAFRQAKTDYFTALPRLGLSRCPHSGQPLVRSFDPWDLRGYWWQEGNLEDTPEPDPGPQFRMLSGAVTLNDLAPEAGTEENAFIGPEVPYVIPRILAMPTMLAVVSRLTLACGYQAYPIAYFSTVKPPRGSLAIPWRRTAYDWEDESGAPCFSHPMDPWDFDLGPWLRQGKLLWIEPDDASLSLRRQGDGPCPYIDLPGERRRQIVLGRSIRYEPPPGNEAIDPFAE